jgi:hypothetical protein
LLIGVSSKSVAWSTGRHAPGRPPFWRPMGNRGHGISGQTRRNQCGVLDISIPSPQQWPSSGDRHMQKAGDFDPVDNVKICGGCAACCCPQGILMQKFHGGFRVRFLTGSAIIWAAGWRVKTKRPRIPFQCPMCHRVGYSLSRSQFGCAASRRSTIVVL